MRLLAEAVNHRKSQAGALADGLGGEERVKRPTDDGFRHATAIVTDAQHNIVTWQQVLVGVGERSVQPLIGGLDHQRTAIRHGIAGIEYQIE